MGTRQGNPNNTCDGDGLCRGMFFMCMNRPVLNRVQVRSERRWGPHGATPTPPQPHPSNMIIVYEFMLTMLSDRLRSSDCELLPNHRHRKLNALEEHIQTHVVVCVIAG